MSTHTTKVSIVGVGMVGREVARYFQEIKHYERGKNLFLYDIDTQKAYNDDIEQGEIVFICTPTPRNKDGACDTTAVESAIQDLKKPHIVVIKSTVPPGTTEKLQHTHPQHQLLFNPEFLTESQAWNDMLRPDRQIVGFTARSVDAAHLVLSLLPQAPFMSPWGSGYKKYELSATEAEMVKVYGNAFFSVKVTFANMIADSCEVYAQELVKMGITDAQLQYDNIKLALGADYRIGPAHLDVYHGGYRGFGGYCLPKDIDALIAFLDSIDVDDELLKATRERNRRLLERQGLTLAEVSTHHYKKESKS